MARIPLASDEVRFMQAPPSPVMERGPTMRVDYSDLARASEEPLLPANMGQAPLQALAGLGKDIQGAATLMADVRARQVRHETQAAAYDAELEMDKAQEEHVLWREQNPDESQWAADFEQRAAVLRGAVLKDSLNPQAKEAVEARLRRFEELGKIRVQADAARATRQRAKAGWVGMIDRAVQSGDVETAKRTAAAGVQEGFIFEGELPQYEERIDKDIEQKARQDAAEAKRAAIDAIISQASNSNAVDVMNALDDERLFPALDPSDRAAVRADLRTMHRQQQMERIGSAWNDIAEGKIKTRADVAALEGIDAVEKEQMIGSLAKRADAAEQARLSDPKVQDAIFADALMRAQEWNKNQPDALVSYREIHQIADQLPAYLRGDVTEIIERKRREAPPAPDEEVRKYAASITEEMHNLEIFSKWKTVDANGKPGVDFAKKDESLRTYSRVNRSIDDFLKKNPNADEFAVKERLSQLVGQSTDAETVRQMLEETMIQTLTNEPPAPPAEPLGTINEADGLPSTGSAYDPTAPNLLFPR